MVELPAFAAMSDLKNMEKLSATQSNLE